MIPELLQRTLSRRALLKLGMMGMVGALTASWWPPLHHLLAAENAIPTRLLGKTGARVTIVGLGGEGALRTWGRGRSATRIIERALDLGITYCDTAPAYSGSQDYYGAILRERRDGLFLASKTHDRSRDGSLRLLESSLKRLQTDHLDLWQLHDLRDRHDLDAIFGSNGAIHAMEEARRDGRVRFLGITGHYDPQILAEAARRYAFDTALVALNAADRTRHSFIEQFLPLASEQGLGVIGMKVLAKGQLLLPAGIATIDQVIAYVLSLPVSTAIIGFETIKQVEDAVQVARQFTPLSSQEMARLETLAQQHAGSADWFKRSS